MKLKKLTKGKVKINYLLIEGTLDLNSKYFKTLNHRNRIFPKFGNDGCSTKY